MHCIFMRLAYLTAVMSNCSFFTVTSQALDTAKVKPHLKQTREERRIEEILQSKYKFRER